LTELDELLNEGIDVNQLLDVVNEYFLISITDLKGDILYSSKKFSELMEYDNNEIIGKNHRIFKSGSHSYEFFKEIWNTITNKKIWHGAILNKTKKGKKIWLKTTIIPIVNNKSISHFIAIRNDITESVKTTEMLYVAQKTMKHHNISLEKELTESRLQMKLQKLSTIGQLASRMSHDMRNPLNVITTSLENIRLLYGDNEGAKNNFERIERAVNRMSRQIDDVLDFVRERPTEKERLVLSNAIKDALSTTSIPPAITIDVLTEDIEIYFDKVMFEVMIKNMIINSMQACKNMGEIKIRSKLDGSHIILEIQDSGPGISQELQDKIFEPLFTTKQSGTGLGLSSCKNIIEKHDGTIQVKNEERGGALFIITFPRKKINKG